MAGISTTWYTWLEQGREINVSAPTLERLSSVLQLNIREREHLFLLAGHEAPQAAVVSTQEAMALVRLAITSMNPNPAYVLNPRWDVVEWNRAAELVFGDFSKLPVSERNIVWLTFCRGSHFRALFQDWERYARCVLGNFRVDSTRYVDHPEWVELTGKLLAESPEFAAWWPDHAIAAPDTYIKELSHAAAGRLCLEPLHLDVQLPSQLMIVTYLPSPGSGTDERLRSLIQEKESSHED